MPFSSQIAFASSIEEIPFAFKTEFILSSETEEAAHRYFEKNQTDPTFGNARGVRNFFDRVVMNQATRILTLPNPSEIEFKTIKKEDIAD